MEDPRSTLVWPSSTEVHAVVATRIERLFAECGGPVADIGRRTMALRNGVLSSQPHSITVVIAPGACMSAGSPWQMAIWPTVAAECIMAAADLFDDVADGDPSVEGVSSGVVLTAAAGLLALASSAVVRVVEDGATGDTAAALAKLLGVEFARAANGQADSLRSAGHVDALTAYTHAAAKSGPLGALIARLGARTATADPHMVDLFGAFGHCLAVRSQLLNDARDAAPNSTANKPDVRAGARTVPLAFTQSTGAPADLSDAEISEWERAERQRVAGAGGLAAALALAEAERLRAVSVLDELEKLGCAVDGVRALAAP